jgi:adenylate cyclase
LTGNRVERRLAAILAADVAGYSRLTGLDEEGTHVRLRERLRGLADPKISEHRGKVVKHTGDGVLAEFGSVVDAVRCAIEVQRGMAEQNAAMTQVKRIEFRVGIHVGDIIVDGNDIFGDGVNIAARLEGIAEPGGVCISDDAYRQIRRPSKILPSPCVRGVLSLVCLRRGRRDRPRILLNLSPFPTNRRLRCFHSRT